MDQMLMVPSSKTLGLDRLSSMAQLNISPPRELPNFPEGGKMPHFCG